MAPPYPMTWCPRCMYVLYDVQWSNHIQFPGHHRGTTCLFPLRRLPGLVIPEVCEEPPSIQSITRRKTFSVVCSSSNLILSPSVKWFRDSSSTIPIPLCALATPLVNDAYQAMSPTKIPQSSLIIPQLWTPSHFTLITFVSR